ncbi:cysteine-rich receptor-like protein kinase 3 isoform X1 [Coffea arabica]|uniref:Cysteine-rich receptor-like protein kinase 3 isoform X1 n=1 Tax=Coffea arabica TaxID=13443 RepID=A0A6P6VDE8_COFAR|nr:cysteine-rich receptor-like protein kinase 3 isoform X1 [Coffea arabica]
MASPLLLIMLVIIFSSNIIRSLSDPRATEAALVCTNKTSSQSDRQVYVASFLAAMDAISPLVARQGYGGVVNGTGNNTVYAFGECMKDLSQTDCNLCFAQCKTQILRCLPFQRLTRGGRLFYDGCYLRYDDYMFFNESLDAEDKTVCGVNDFGGNQSLFKANVAQLVRNMSVEAPKTDGFFKGFVNRGNLTVYGLAQCWEFVNGTSCEKCLKDSVSRIGSCPPKDEGRVLNAGCYLRYSTKKFYDNSSTTAPSGNGGGSRRVAIILAATFSAVAFLLILAFISFFAKKRVMKQKREKKQLGALLQTVNKSRLNISYETLERATDYFNNANKLGQGGSGSVYKGVLPNGQAVAVKRLFFNTTQWVDHFFNEVNLISGIQHKNLVQLLGCSITGPESLLVYEYVPNGSLHDHIFVKKNVQPLSWEDRYKIILGTAEGLAFLHEESKLRIIHRDIKLSNILVDESFTPKIADFGLARLFPEDKTHISTAIAGTLGYMAPEYVVRGKLTEKADVYSFGVLVIEVICGKRNNNAVSQNSFSVLQKAWKLYGTGKLGEAVEASLQGNFIIEEASRLLQIGLLCVQASAELRPSMSVVVKMLNNQHEIAQPTQPPFLNCSSSDISPLNRSGTPYFQSDSYTQSSGNDMTDSFIEAR